ncbi:unnamed protein product [Polarella glacialis]|uniref:Phosphofructokinase domain-containing protein n=1 Tax=Polarella glacialis TaxID=89957 RepID=A0A813ES22_POLGL|nr:unnamed protein product [Polarella glacialis]CAE8650553.1 unnamed protein product [Polarella glacialis]
MAGYTGVTIGKVCERYVVLPIQAITQQPQKRVDLKGRWFIRLVSTTKQPELTADGEDASNNNTKKESENTDLSLQDISERLDFSDIAQILDPANEIRRLALGHLKDQFGSKEHPTTLAQLVQGADLGFLDEESLVTQSLNNLNNAQGGQVKLQMVLAGPRQNLHFKPQEVAAAIVNCGGLCPGLNSVIRELVMMLYAYGVRKVYGIKGGFNGAVNPQTWLTLTPQNVMDIHTKGGSILVADRGNPPHEEIARVLRSKGVRQYFVIGGDGTHRGADQTYNAMRALSWECAVIGVPKTIDNDIAILDRTFGFDTACTEALKAINTAYVESTCNANCIGLVKLMGRHCGYLAMTACLSARNVDICLLPEMDLSLEKILDHCAHLLRTQGHAVLVVAEGCGDTLIKGSEETDAGGNKKLADPGLFLKDAITAHFQSLKLPLTIKYVDPTYMVRAVPANSNDSIYCSTLAQAAVHAAMVDDTFVYLPVKAITDAPNRKVDVQGRWFEQLLATTLQPNLSIRGSTTAKPIDPILGQRLFRPRQNSGDEAELDAIKVPNTTLTILDGYGQEKLTRSLERTDIVASGVQVRQLPCFHLGDRFGSFKFPSPLKGRTTTVFQDAYSWAAQSMYIGNTKEPYYQMVQAGPREHLHFDPNDPAACAAIVSCGGICPGLNSVIREVVMMLWSYGVRRIFGIRGGFKGVVEPSSWIQLTPEVVKDIHMQGGTILVSDRGNPPHIDQARVLQEQGVRQYFVLGGDGTHQGAMKTFDACLKIGHECSVIGVPKTIDNDVPMLDQTFGFDTACTEALKAVDSAYVEATCNANCIGLVKLMGRHCGFIALHACLASRNADICLLPEMDIDLEKVLAHTAHLMKTKGHAVIVVAEGCGDTIIQSSGELDAGGNKKLADVGPWLKGAITDRFKSLGLPLTIKYIDPTYMIRAIPANAFDSQYCAILAQHAVHGALAGYSGVTVGKIHERFVYLPIHAITMQKGRRVSTKDRWFMRMRESTQQPEFKPDGPQPLPGPPEVNVLDTISSLSSINKILEPGDVIKRLQVLNLSDTFPSANLQNPLPQSGVVKFRHGESWATKCFVHANRRDDRGHVYYQMLMGGPREKLHFNPAEGAAVIVTCGGLCPGLNSVIRELVMTLESYGVPKIWGCKGGYMGMLRPESWLELNREVVKDIHLQGGTILVSDRGNPPPEDVARVLKDRGVSHYFTIGGDGTHAGAMAIFDCMQQLGHNCSVVGVPKTIDNDIPILDRSFGYKTACQEAVKAIYSAYTEAVSNTGCIGLVKLMGRHCGWIAMEATLAARQVDICLMPEMEISMPKLLTHAMHLVKTRGYAVIVVAEGCGDTLVKSTGEKDPGGNKKLTDVAPWLQAQLLEYFQQMQVPLSVKLIDPTYTIRAIRANANDSIYCSVLAQNAVHGSMAGFSGITVGKVDERYVMLPIHAITKLEKSRKVELNSRQFERLMAGTGQPSLAPGPGDDWALMPPAPPPRAAAEPEGEVPEVSCLAWRGLTAGEPMEGPDQVLEGADQVLEGGVLRVLDGFGDLDLLKLFLFFCFFC